MDEPTTHLDMASIDALIGALDQYEGTLIFISHDVHFIRALAKKVLHIDTGKLTPYAGGYDYYLEKAQRHRRPRGPRGRATRRPPPLTPRQPPRRRRPTAPPTARKTKEQKRAEAEARSADVPERNASARNACASWNARSPTSKPARRQLAAELEDEATYQQPGRPMELNRELTFGQRPARPPDPRMGKGRRTRAERDRLNGPLSTG